MNLPTSFEVVIVNKSPLKSSASGNLYYMTVESFFIVNRLSLSMRTTKLTGSLTNYGEKFIVGGANI